MERYTRNASILILMIAALIILVVGCSTDKTPLGPASSPVQTQVAPQAPALYPPLNDDFLSKIPGGYRPLSIVSSGLDDHCDSIETSRWCRDESYYSVVSLRQLVSITLTRGDLSRDTTITIIAPSGCMAVADFYPHPYHFNGTVEITWNIASLNLPRNFDYSTIVPWYVTEAGEFIPLQYEWRHGHDQLVVYTNHFSRYILGEAL